jgi:phosphate transport system substrate-binding protein
MSRNWLVIAVAAALSLGVAACGDDDENGGDGGGSLSGEVVIDGSSTVAPLSEAIGVQFANENQDVRTTVGTSGTGGGFEKFCAGETDISDASRQIEQEEIDLCAEGGIEWEEVTVANDALTVVVHPDNPVTCITVDQLNQIYGPDATVTSWGDVDGLDAEFSEDLEIFSPGADSGTFDYFTDAINGEEGAQRSKDVNVVGEDDNATVTGVSGSPGGIGYFGYSFYVENQDQLKALEVDGGDGCVAPSEETTQSGDYAPLGRQLYIYPSAEALRRDEVAAFVDYYLANVNDVASGTGFIPLTDDQLTASEEKVAKLVG